uniref:Uncharacterized protein n=1 Tax=Pseudomonas phage KV2023 TaxID=3234047 RepID=A0AB39C6N2_9CAUD
MRKYFCRSANSLTRFRSRSWVSIRPPCHLLLMHATGPVGGPLRALEFV